MPHNAIKLLVNASDAGLHITGLDGWTQTRLAKTLQIRRETLNAIINRSPGSEPTDERPRMIEACQKLIIFAAALSAKEDVILKSPIDVANLQTDDGQAYEHHRLRLHRLVEEAVEGNQFTNALCRIGEFASAAMHAPVAYRLRMICNLMTAIQRLLDKPASREVPTAVLRANLVRLYRAERMSRRIGRESAIDDSVREQLDYVRGQAGYALVFSGILLTQPRLVRRGGTRLFRAISDQPAQCCGHWSNLLRATNDLLAGFPIEAHDWATRMVMIAQQQSGNGFAAAYSTLKSKGEIQRLRTHWAQSDEKSEVDQLLKAAALKNQQNGVATFKPAVRGAVAAISLSLAVWVTASAFAGDGRDFKSSQSDPGNTPRVPSQPAPQSTSATARPQNPTATGTTTGIASPKAAVSITATRTPATGSRPVVRLGGIGRFRIDDTDVDSRSNRDVDARGWDVAIASGNADVAMVDERLIRSLEDAWGDNINAYARVANPPVKIVPVQKPFPEREVKVAIAPIVPPVRSDPADNAAKALGMAKNYLSTGDETIARRKLQEIVKNYPETPAAQQAQAMLEQLAVN